MYRAINTVSIISIIPFVFWNSFGHEIFVELLKIENNETIVHSLFSLRGDSQFEVERDFYTAEENSA